MQEAVERLKPLGKWFEKPSTPIRIILVKEPEIWDVHHPTCTSKGNENCLQGNFSFQNF